MSCPRQQWVPAQIPHSRDDGGGTYNAPLACFYVSYVSQYISLPVNLPGTFVLLMVMFYSVVSGLCDIECRATVSSSGDG